MCRVCIVSVCIVACVMQGVKGLYCRMCVQGLHCLMFGVQGVYCLMCVEQRSRLEGCTIRLPFPLALTEAAKGFRV